MYNLNTEQAGRLGAAAIVLLMMLAALGAMISAEGSDAGLFGDDSSLRARVTTVDGIDYFQLDASKLKTADSYTWYMGDPETTEPISTEVSILVPLEDMKHRQEFTLVCTYDWDTKTYGWTYYEESPDKNFEDVVSTEQFFFIALIAMAVGFLILGVITYDLFTMGIGAIEGIILIACIFTGTFTELFEVWFG